MEPARVASKVDYSLARRAVLREYHAGRVSRFDICDAHPDLLRAARYSGEVTDSLCPICEDGFVSLVSYAFSDEFPKKENGKVWPRREVSELTKLREVRLYTVEVCSECSWNHLLTQMSLGKGKSSGGAGGSAKRPRRASE